MVDDKWTGTFATEAQKDRRCGKHSRLKTHNTYESAARNRASFNLSSQPKPCPAWCPNICWKTWGPLFCFCPGLATARRLFRAAAWMRGETAPTCSCSHIPSSHVSCLLGRLGPGPRSSHFDDNFITILVRLMRRNFEMSPRHSQT
jgi:hypothetical protein